MKSSLIIWPEIQHGGRERQLAACEIIVWSLEYRLTSRMAIRTREKHRYWEDVRKGVGGIALCGVILRNLKLVGHKCVWYQYYESKQASLTVSLTVLVEVKLNSVRAGCRAERPAPVIR